MLKRKLNMYNLTASIHTVQIDSGHIPVVEEGDERFIKSRNTIATKTGELTSRNIINPHNFGAGELTRYSLYEDVMTALTNKVELYTFKYNRIDIRLDSYDDNYSDYFKLNSLFIGLFTMLYKFKNDEPTESAGQKTRYKCGVYVKNQYLSIDYYNKKKESLDRYPCKARLEFRATRLNGKTPVEVVEQWFKRFDKLAEQYNRLQEEYNCYLYQYYLKWLSGNKPKKRDTKMLTPFVRENKDCFFTSRQLMQFCDMCGIKNPMSRANSLKKTCNIEFISHSDITDYIEIIKNSIMLYMNQ